MDGCSWGLVAALGWAWSTACWLVRWERRPPGTAKGRGATVLLVLCAASAWGWLQARPVAAAVVEGILCQGVAAVVVVALAALRPQWVARSGYASAGVGGSALLWGFLQTGGAP